MEIIDIDDFTVVAYEFFDMDMTHYQQHDVALELLKNVLYDCYGINYDEKMVLKGKHNKPYFEDECVYFNITHTKGMAACIVCGNSEVGIDGELVRAGRERVIRKFMTQAEQGIYESLEKDCKDEYMFRLWTLKEAVAKAYGTGIDENFSKREFKLSVSDNPVCSDSSFWYHQWEVFCEDRKYIISAALEK